MRNFFIKLMTLSMTILTINLASADTDALKIYKLKSIERTNCNFGCDQTAEFKSIASLSYRFGKNDDETYPYAANLYFFDANGNEVYLVSRAYQQDDTVLRNVFVRLQLSDPTSAYGTISLGNGKFVYVNLELGASKDFVTLEHRTNKALSPAVLIKKTFAVEK